MAGEADHTLFALASGCRAGASSGAPHYGPMSTVSPPATRHRSVASSETSRMRMYRKSARSSVRGVNRRFTPPPALTLGPHCEGFRKRSANSGCVKRVRPTPAPTTRYGCQFPVVRSYSTDPVRLTTDSFAEMVGLSGNISGTYVRSASKESEGENVRPAESPIANEESSHPRPGRCSFAIPATPVTVHLACYGLRGADGDNGHRQDKCDDETSAIRVIARACRRARREPHIGVECEVRAPTSSIR